MIPDSLVTVHAWHLKRRCSSSPGTGLSQYTHVLVGRSPRSCARTAVHRAPVKAPLSSALSSSVSLWDTYASVRPLFISPPMPAKSLGLLASTRSSSRFLCVCVCV